jgi:hypothetical protein
MSPDEIPSILTRAELETPRSAADMLAWVDQAHRRFNTKELKAQALEGKHFNGEFVHEARPMALFAERHFKASPQVIITHVLGNQNYDGIVEDKRDVPELIRYLEVTTTLKTYEDSLRLEVLNKDGHVPAYGRVTAVGPRHKREAIRTEKNAIEHGVIRDEHLKRVRDVVEGKVKKNYPPGTVLIVAVDDFGPFREQADVHALELLVSGVLLPALRGKNFAALALEGDNGLHRWYPIA